MNGGVLALGTSLIVANGISSGQLKDISSVASTSGSNQNTQIGGQQAMLMITGEVIFVLILASMSDGGGAGIAIALLIGLWLIWLMENGPSATGFVQLLQGKFTPNAAAKPGQ